MKQTSNVSYPVSDMVIVNERYADKLITVSSSDIDKHGKLTFNTIKICYFEDYLKHKFDMTMILKIFLKRNINNQIHVFFEISTDRKFYRILNAHNFFNYICPVVLKGKICHRIKVQLTGEINPFIRIGVLKDE